MESAAERQLSLSQDKFSIGILILVLNIKTEYYMGQTSQVIAGQQLHTNDTQCSIHFLNYDSVISFTINDSIYFLNKILNERRSRSLSTMIHIHFIACLITIVFFFSSITNSQLSQRFCFFSHQSQIIHSHFHYISQINIFISIIMIIFIIAIFNNLNFSSNLHEFNIDILRHVAIFNVIFFFHFRTQFLANEFKIFL